MSLLLYNIFLFFYETGIAFYSLLNEKAQKWIDGRWQWQNNIKRRLHQDETRIWMHCSSLGEFEQGRPLIEYIRTNFPSYKIVISFFSPSGYEIAKNYKNADYVFYLPMDGKQNARDFIALIQPSLVIFVKYEFWYHYLQELEKKKIPTILISAAFRKSQPFFKWWGKFFRGMLACFNYIFVQDEHSKNLLNEIHLVEQVFATGDTRYDRVGTIAKKIWKFEPLSLFTSGEKILIAGSTWPADEKILKNSLDCLPADWKIIIAPHEIDKPHISKIQELFGSDSILYSELLELDQIASQKILIIDNIGLLSSIYGYGTIAYIGGGFQKGGIHNILEPAIFGLPVIFGPGYKKFVEAKTFVDLNFAFPVANASEFRKQLEKFIRDDQFWSETGDAIKTFMTSNMGATQRILDILQERHWLK